MSAHRSGRIEAELARHDQRYCPACGTVYARSEGRIPKEYLIDHCKACAQEIERRQWVRKGTGGNA